MGNHAQTRERAPVVSYLRSGFFAADDFHGKVEREVFEQLMRLVFPDRPILDIPDDDAIFHVAYYLADRSQIPGQPLHWRSALV
jgi:hypothetical protein